MTIRVHVVFQRTHQFSYNTFTILKTSYAVFKSDLRVYNYYSLVIFLSFTADINNLENVVIGMKLKSANVDLDVVLQELLSKTLHLLGPGSTPHECLSVRLK